MLVNSLFKLKFVNEKITAKILMQARKQQSELQDEYGIGVDDNEDQQQQQLQQNDAAKSTAKFLLSSATTTAAATKLTDDVDTSSGFNFRPFKKLQTSRLQQQQIRKSDHDDSDSDSDTDEHLEDCENKRDFYSDEEIVSIPIYTITLLILYIFSILIFVLFFSLLLIY